jgi:hypothetical protein
VRDLAAGKQIAKDTGLKVGSVNQVLKLAFPFSGAALVK